MYDTIRAELYAQRKAKQWSTVQKKKKAVVGMEQAAGA
jgi:hypothetical protein